MSENPSSDLRPAALAALVALAIYAVTLGGTYVYDDRYIVQNDPRIADASNWGEYWTKDYFYGGADNLYRPLVSMTYALQVRLHGNGERAAWAFHLVNWLLHAAVSAAVAELARRMTRSSAVAVIAGLLFAVHPIHVEAVANIVGRAELMCGLGMIGALVFYLRRLTVARAVAIWGCFVLAMLSKEQGILLPLLLLAATPLCRPTQRNAVLTLALLMLWTLAGYIFFRERILKFWWDRAFLDSVINPIVDSQGRDRWLMPFALLGRYVALLIAPIKLCPDYGGKIIGSTISLGDPYLYAGVAATIGGASALIVCIARRAWAVLLCLFSFAALFGLVSNLLTIIGVNFAERLMYTPSAFACILVAMAAARPPRRALVPVVAIVLALLSIRTVTYAWQWNDRLRLYRHGARHWPQSVRLQMLLADELADVGEVDEAVTTIAAARKVHPEYYKVWQRSAVIALKANRLEEAFDFAGRAQRMMPTMGGMELINAINERRAAATRPASGPAATPAKR